MNEKALRNHTGNVLSRLKLARNSAQTYTAPISTLRSHSLDYFMYSEQRKKNILATIVALTDPL